MDHAELTDYLGIIDRHGSCTTCPLGCTCTYCSEFLGTGEQCATGPRTEADLQRTDCR
jgi:hypothetical protein